MNTQLQKHPKSDNQIDGPSLTLRQKRFVRYYVETCNATEAARLAGYSGNDVTLASVGYENLRKSKILAEIERLGNPIADAEEVLHRLTKRSRARISDVLTDAGEFDLQTAKDNDADDLIKKLKIRKTRRTTAQGESIEEVTHEHIHLLRGSCVVLWSRADTKPDRTLAGDYRRRRLSFIASNPAPSNPKVAGSGTSAVLGSKL